MGPETIALGVVGLLLLLAWHGGGFSASTWGPVGVVLLIVLGVALAVGAVAPAGRRETIMLAAGAAFCAWSYLSATWAAFPGEAIVGSGRTVVYFACFALLLLLPGPRRRLLLAFGFGVAALAAIVLVRLGLASNPGRYFLDNRLNDPVGYTNGDAGLWTIGACVLLLPASQRQARPVFRGACVAAIVLLLEAGLLCESRAWLFLLPIVAAVAIVLAQSRWQVLICSALAAVVVVVSAHWVTRIYDDATSVSAVRGGVAAILCSVAAAGALGFAWGLMEQRLPAPGERVQRGLTVAVIAAVLLGVGGVVAAKPDLAHPVARVESAWRSFKTPYAPADPNRSRLTQTLASDRWRDWLVAYRAFVREPVAGIGADNYEALYLREREDALFDPQFPHSTVLQVLSQLGLIGALLLLGWIGPAFAAALGARRSADPDVALPAQTGMLVFFYWLAHGSFDWFWAIPGLAAPAFALLALGARRPAASMSVRASVRAGVAVAAAIGCLLLLPPWFENLLVTHGATVSASSPSDAKTDFRWAARIEPWSAEPYLYLGSLELNRGQIAPAAAAFEHAARREPENWYAHLQLAVTAVQTGEFAAATRQAEQARRLNPKDPVSALVARLIRRHVVFAPSLPNRLYVEKETRQFHPQS